MTDPINIPAVSARDDDEISVRRLIAIGLTTRLAVDTAIQTFFPFLPVIAAGLGTTSVVLGRLVSLRSAMGLFAPLFGSLADRKGYRTTMRLGLLLGAAGYLIVGLSSQIWLTAVGMIIAGLGTFSFVPTLQAYLSTRLPFNRRARGLGTLEYSWALSGIFGLFLIGQIIELWGWRVPFFILSGFMLLAFLLYRRLPAARAVVPPGTSPKPIVLSWPAVRRFFDLGANGRSARSALLVSGCVMFAAMNVFINYGTWLEADYGLGAAQLGTVALVLGFSDLSGSVLASLVGDRLGKRRTLLWGTAVATVAYGLLPFFNQGVLIAVAGLLVARFAFEFSIVGVITLVSEQVPQQRGKMMTMTTAAALLGSSLAGFTGPVLYAQTGVSGISIVSFIIMSIGLFILFTRVHEKATG